LPPTKLYFASPVHLAAGAGNPGGKSGAKSKLVMTMSTPYGFSRSCLYFPFLAGGEACRKRRAALIGPSRARPVKPDRSDCLLDIIFPLRSASRSLAAIVSTAWRNRLQTGAALICILMLAQAPKSG
jgi:hypothetical protein